MDKGVRVRGRLPDLIDNERHESMKLYGKAQQVADSILDAFARGDVPKALAQIFIHHECDCPSEKWSWRNRLIAALFGHYDARGFRQWKEVGRQVKKGQKAFHILAPRTAKAKEDDAERGIEAGDTLLVGFIAVPVFGYLQTEGEPLPGREDEAAFIDGLPLVEVARSWGLSVGTFNGQGSGKLGFYHHGTAIALGVENLSTWGHELVHSADDRLGTLTRRIGQQLDNEVVAEFGGSVLLECLGFTAQSDRGGAFEYIEAYAKQHDKSAIGVCTDLIERTCACVVHILESARELAAGETEAEGAAVAAA